MAMLLPKSVQDFTSRTKGRPSRSRRKSNRLRPKAASVLTMRAPLETGQTAFFDQPSHDGIGEMGVEKDPGLLPAPRRRR